MTRRLVLLALVVWACHAAPPAAPKPSESPRALAAVDRLNRLLKRDAPQSVRWTPSVSGLVPDFSIEPVGTARRADVVLPNDGAGTFSLTDRKSGVALRVRLSEAATSPAETAQGHAVYAGAFRKGDLIQRPSLEGTEDFVFIATTETRELSYVVSLDARVAGLRQIDNVLEFLDQEGAPRLRIAPPYVVDAEGTRREAQLGVSGCQVDHDLRMPWGRPTVPPGADECRVRVSWDASGLVPPFVVDPSWQTTGSMTNQYSEHAAISLGGGRVLLYANLHSEIFDFATGTWAANGSPTAFSRDGVLVKLSDGRILAAGGDQPTASVWNPTNGSWSNIAAYGSFGAGGEKVVALPNGTVLGIGGYNPCPSCPAGATSLKTIARLNISTLTWTDAGQQLRTERRFAPGVVYSNNSAIVCGGLMNAGYAASDCEIVTDGASSTTAVTGPLPTGLQIGQEPNSSMYALPDGSVFLNCHYGNSTGDSKWFGDSWAYKTGWNSVGLSVDRCQMAIAPLSVGKTLFVGGVNENRVPQSVTDILGSGATTSLPATRAYATASLISDGRVLVAGGGGNTDLFTSAIVYTSPVTCSQASECLSGFCVDGYCCNSACNSGCGTCDAPGSEGWCSPRPDGDSGSPACAPSLCDGSALSCASTCAGDADCADTAWCDSNHHCQFKSAPGGACQTGDECLVGFCVDHVCCDQACDGACDACTKAKGAASDGTCAQLVGTPGTPSCAPFVCGGSSDDCPTTCAGNDELCVSTNYCDGAGACIPKVNYPAACTADSQCSTGLCANGTCCDKTCLDGCDTCTAAAGASADGICTVLPKSDPGAPSCTPYLCGGTAGECPTTCAADTDCANGNWCNAAHHCVAKAAQGGSCTLDNQCSTGHCTQFVCCDQSCRDGCDACTVAKGASADGTCTTLTAGAEGLPGCGAYVCDGAGNACPTSCVGDSDCSSIAYCHSSHQCVARVVKGISCETDHECVTNHCADGVCCDKACDGSCDACSRTAGATADGTCTTLPLGNAGTPICAPYLCSGSAVTCPATCTGDNQCVSGDYCDSNHQCVPKLGSGATCGSDNQCSTAHCADGVCCDQACNGACDACKASLGASADGVCTNTSGAGSPSCAPYLCVGAGAACPATCQSDTQCATGNYCDANHHCVAKGAQGASCSAANQCLNATCVDGFCCDKACGGACDACARSAGATADGTCTVVALGKPGAPVCAPYVCDGSAATCPTTCTSDAQCDASDFCDTAHHCVSKRTGGSACTGANQCQSGSCSDAVCCDKACDGACDVCSAAFGATQNGVCTLVPSGSSGSPFCSPYVCSGSSASCPTSCTSDAQCVTGDYCNASHQCVPKIAGGQSCSADSQCASSHCADSKCCNQACGDACDVCAASLGATADGSCTIVGGAGAPSCAPYLCGGTAATCPTTCASDAVCAPGDYCDANHHCVAQGALGGTCSAANQCLSGKCVDGFCCNSDCSSGCDVCAASLGAVANGVCTILPAHAVGAPSCAPYVCSGRAECPTFCTSDAQCQAGDYCDATGACVPLIANAQRCDSAHACSSGFCVDGLCCDAACQGSCERCDLSGHTGTCTSVAAGASEACLPLKCDGVGSSCPTACLGNGDCAAGFVCLAGSCAPAAVNGAHCGEGLECASGFCVDHVCCNSSCEGSCATCALPGKAGTCSLVTGAAAPERTACAGSGLCVSTCDGQHTECQFPPQTTSCGPAFCSEATATAAAFCDGQGACVVGAQTACGSGCEGDHCAPTPKSSGCASTGPDWLALLALLLPFVRSRRATLKGGL